MAALDQPVRRELHALLAAAPGWTTRDDAATALGLARSVAAFHLDKLADAGVVDVRFERTGGRSGPGAGRPSKLYRLRGDEVAASVPDRRYDLAGSLLAEAVAESARSGLPVRDCLRAAARDAGRSIGREAGDAPDVGEVLEGLGYEPRADDGEGIVLVNCPFHRLAEEQRALVCGMNLDFVEGLLDGMTPGAAMTARLEPVDGFCCVRIGTA